jgi:hypothetical protein
MAEAMRELFATRMREQTEKATTVRADLQKITDRIRRLRERLRDGDPDLEPDEPSSSARNPSTCSRRRRRRRS